MKKIDFASYAIKLSQGSHNCPEEGMCVMECVAYIAGEEHTDRPTCTNGPLAALAIALNDSAPSEEHRQMLLSLVPRLAGAKDLGETFSVNTWNSAYRLQNDLDELLYKWPEICKHTIVILGPNCHPEQLRLMQPEYVARWQRGFQELEALLPKETEYTAPVVYEQKAKELELITSK